MTTTNLMPMTEHDLRQFTYANGDLVTEVSNLAADFRCERIFRDACDVGIAIRSHYTGNVERFYLTRIMRDAEDEVTGWEFKPVNPSKCDVSRVFLFND